MPNDLQEVMDTLVMPAALPVLREACVMPALVATDFGATAHEQYETIRVPLPVDFGSADDMNPASGSSSSDLKPKKVDIQLKHWKYKQFQMNDQEMRESITAGFLPRAAEAAVKVIANSINLDIWALYKKIPFYAGAAGTTPDEKSDIIQVRKVLQNNLCPIADRRLVMDTEAEAEYLDLFSDVDKTGSTEALIAASLGVKFGFDTFCDQLAPRHTFGTLASSTPLVNGAVLAEAAVMNIDGGAGTETIQAGDTFTVANVKDAHGNPRQFVFTADKVATAGAITGATFYPPAPTGGFADNAAITITRNAGGTDYAINMAFHRDAFMFAARALQTEQSENSTISVAVDPVTGIPLRLETWREPGKATRMWRFDLLYGCECLRPELAARLHG